MMINPAQSLWAAPGFVLYLIGAGLKKIWLSTCCLNEKELEKQQSGKNMKPSGLLNLKVFFCCVPIVVDFDFRRALL